MPTPALAPSFPQTRVVPAAPAAEPAPFVKWVGGKGRILPQLLPLLPTGVQFMRHVEPFLGGAAMFFARRPRRALLCDVNPELMATYRHVREDVESVIKALGPLAREHCSERYYEVRARYNSATSVGAERAAMFVYLNKTCFNGLHRVNRRGQFNVPAGRYRNPRILNANLLRAASAQLRKAELKCSGFEGMLRWARPGDFIYLDPPYAPVSATANFTAYATDGFAAEDQVRLRDSFRALSRRGCKLMLSNSDVPLIRDLYAEFQLDTIAAPRSVNCDAKRRGLVSELVIRNYR